MLDCRIPETLTVAIVLSPLYSSVFCHTSLSSQEVVFKTRNEIGDILQDCGIIVVENPSLLTVLSELGISSIAGWGPVVSSIRRTVEFVVVLRLLS